MRARPRSASVYVAARAAARKCRSIIRVACRGRSAGCGNVPGAAAGRRLGKVSSEITMRKINLPRFDLGTYFASAAASYAKCESPAERNLLDLLCKTEMRIEQQYSVGRFRIDAVTGADTFAEPVPFDGCYTLAEAYEEMFRVRELAIPEPVFCPMVGWEVDGKQFHEESRDSARDKWILENSDVRQIVRIPAAALLYFRDAVLCGLAAKFPAFVSFRSRIHPLDVWMEEADNIADRIENREYSQEQADWFADAECCDVFDNEIHVGSPLAFMPPEHRLINMVSRSKRIRWIGRIIIRD